MSGLQVQEIGEHALLVHVPDALAAADLAGWLRELRVPAGEVIPAACTVLLDDLTDHDAARKLIDRWRLGDAPVRGALVTIPVEYTGPDLAAVAEVWRCTESEVVARHTGTEFTAAFTGFAPGFAYLVGLPWAVPRLPVPRTRVRPGSVGLADRYTGIYPTASPGGWQLIGQSDAVLWDPAREHPALLTPGTRVRFQAA